MKIPITKTDRRKLLALVKRVIRGEPTARAFLTLSCETFGLDVDLTIAEGIAFMNRAKQRRLSE
jgi:hypothetical protein